METLGNQLKQLEEEIKADETGKMEFERLLAQVGSTGSSPRDENSDNPYNKIHLFEKLQQSPDGNHNALWLRARSMLYRTYTYP